MDATYMGKTLAVTTLVSVSVLLASATAQASTTAAPAAAIARKTLLTASIAGIAQKRAAVRVQLLGAERERRQHR
jgi:hypothetical protein